VLGEQHPDTARSYNNLGRLLQAMGDYTTAQPYLERALAIYEKSLGSIHPSTEAMRSNLVDLEREMKKTE